MSFVRLGLLLLAWLGLGDAALNFGKHVIELTPDNFAAVTEPNDKSVWLVMFYFDGCPHCVEFAPTFADIAQTVAGW